MPLLSSICHILLWPAFLCSVIAAPQVARQATPTVSLDSATFTGVTNSTTGVTSFLGIPFAQPPWVVDVSCYKRRAARHEMVCMSQLRPCWLATLSSRTGSLRFQLPQALPAYSGSYQATQFGLACYQQPTNLPLPASLPVEIASIIVNEFDSKNLPSGEDCMIYTHMCIIIYIILTKINIDRSFH